MAYDTTVDIGTRQELKTTISGGTALTVFQMLAKNSGSVSIRSDRVTDGAGIRRPHYSFGPVRPSAFIPRPRSTKTTGNIERNARSVAAF